MILCGFFVKHSNPFLLCRLKYTLCGVHLVPALCNRGFWLFFWIMKNVDGLPRNCPLKPAMPVWFIIVNIFHMIMLLTPTSERWNGNQQLSVILQFHQPVILRNSFSVFSFKCPFPLKKKNNNREKWKHCLLHQVLPVSNRLKCFKTFLETRNNKSELTT